MKGVDDYDGQTCSANDRLCSHNPNQQPTALCDLPSRHISTSLFIFQRASSPLRGESSTTCTNMPTLYSRSTTIQLSIADLPKTTTHDHKSHLFTHTSVVANVAAELARGAKDGTLTEVPLYAKDTDTRMRFIGANGDMPFYMVRAGKHLFDPSTNNTRTRRPERIPLSGTTQPPVPNASTSAHESGSTQTMNNEDAAVLQG